MWRAARRGAAAAARHTRAARARAHRVPNLQLDVLVVDLNRAGSEFDANRQIVLLTEALVCELEEQAGLADTYSNC